MNVRAVIVMPNNAPRIKFELTHSFGARIIPYEIADDHITGKRDRLVQEIADNEGAVLASPYDDNAVIAGNGAGGLEIADELQRMGRRVSHFFCQVSGGGLMAGHSLAIADAFPTAAQVAVEPEHADDFRRSLAADARCALDRPESLCDGLLSYSVGEHNWPILRRHVSQCVAVPDSETCKAMRWLYENHRFLVEPSGAITVAAVLSKQAELDGNGDIVIIISGRNVDTDRFSEYVSSEVN